MPIRRLTVTLALAAALAAPATAWADADPASDYLPGFDSYLPSGNTVAKPEQGQLDRLLKIARARDRPFKVAVIATPVDLGAVTALYDKPAPYAKFLYREIKGLLQGSEATLVVVMPAGVGVEGRGRITARRVTAAMHPGASASPTQLTSDAVAAVEKIAAAGGRPLPHVAPTAAPVTAVSHASHRKFLGLLIAGLLLAVGAALLIRARALRRTVSSG